MLFLHLEGGMTPVPSTSEGVSTQRKRKTSAKDAAKSSDEKGTIKQRENRIRRRMRRSSQHRKKFKKMKNRNGCHDED